VSDRSCELTTSLVAQKFTVLNKNSTWRFFNCKTWLFDPIFPHVVPSIFLTSGYIQPWYEYNHPPGTCHPQQAVRWGGGELSGGPVQPKLLPRSRQGVQSGRSCPLFSPVNPHWVVARGSCPIEVIAPEVVRAPCLTEVAR